MLTLKVMLLEVGPWGADRDRGLDSGCRRRKKAPRPLPPWEVSVLGQEDMVSPQTESGAASAIFSSQPPEPLKYIPVVYKPPSLSGPRNKAGG